MVAVAIVAALLFGEHTRRRSATRSAEYRAKAELATVISEWPRGWADGPMVADLDREQRETAKRVAEYQAELAKIYTRAACYPWLALSPDPPPSLLETSPPLDLPHNAFLKPATDFMGGLGNE